MSPVDDRPSATDPPRPPGTQSGKPLPSKHHPRFLASSRPLSTSLQFPSLQRFTCERLAPPTRSSSTGAVPLFESKHSAILCKVPILDGHHCLHLSLSLDVHPVFVLPPPDRTLQHQLGPFPRVPTDLQSAIFLSLGLNPLPPPPSSSSSCASPLHVLRPLTSSSLHPPRSFAVFTRDLASSSTLLHIHRPTTSGGLLSHDSCPLNTSAFPSGYVSRSRLP